MTEAVTWLSTSGYFCRSDKNRSTIYRVFEDLTMIKNFETFKVTFSSCVVLKIFFFDAAKTVNSVVGLAPPLSN